MIGKKTMNQKQKNNESTLLANTKGQPLKEHSMAVALYGHLLLKSLNFKPDKERQLNKCLISAGLLHDIGKVSKDFQKYIHSKSNVKDDFKEIPMDAESFRPKSFKGPFHNEISWAYIANFVRFNNGKIKDIVRHSVYWHHPANCNDKEDTLRFENSKVIFEKIEEDNIKQNIYKFVKELFDSFPLYDQNSNKPDLEEPNDDIEEIQCPKFFKHESETVYDNAFKQICLNLLLESDRAVSLWDITELQEFLQNWKDRKSIFAEKKLPFHIMENLNKNSKSKEQNDLAYKMSKSNKKLAVCGVDPAGGKTSIALYWWHHCQNKHPLIIALPRQHQVTGLFYSIKEDCKRIYGKYHNIKIEGVFNGERKRCNPEAEKSSELLTSDINIMVFDRFLSPYYKRSQSSEFIKMLRSHLVLDEFHEFKEHPKMIPALKEILTIRSRWLHSEVKTLMLSGTPDPSLLKYISVEDSCVFKRDQLSARENHKFKISAQSMKIEKINTFKPDCLYSFLRVENSQEIFAKLLKAQTDQIKLIHSYFTDEDKKELLESILQEHGSKKILISDKSVITSKMLQSSYNLSFQKALVELSQPHADCQTAGRINRFENKKDAQICFIYNDETEKFFNKRKADFQEIHKKWQGYLLDFIQQQDGNFITIRDLMKAYDNFWTDENIKVSCEILERQQTEAIKDLNKYIPKRSLSGKNKKAQVFNSLFRGESRLLSACVVDDDGQPVKQLQGVCLLSESRDWFITKITEAMRVCLETKSKCQKANQINNSEEVFEFNKYIKIYGFKLERPLLCSHVDEEINQCLSEHLKDQDNNKTEHRVYHKKFGLVKEDLLKILKK